jgi:hypothetical protein
MPLTYAVIRKVFGLFNFFVGTGHQFTPRLRVDADGVSRYRNDRNFELDVRLRIEHRIVAHVTGGAFIGYGMEGRSSNGGLVHRPPRSTVVRDPSRLKRSARNLRLDQEPPSHLQGSGCRHLKLT